MEALFALGGVIVFLWIVPVFVAHKNAKEKGYEPGVGIALGLFLGWIGVLIVALIGDKRSGATNGSMRACPHCSEPVQRAAKVCKHCGRDIAALSSPGGCPECGAPPAHPPTPRCVNCGAVKV